MLFLRAIVLLVVFSCLSVGCRSSDYLAAHEARDWSYSVSDDVREAWFEHRSYYALIEIIDSELPHSSGDPMRNATRAQVEAALGRGHQPLQYYEWEDIDTCPAWQYSSRRKVPYGSYVSFHFNEEGYVTSIDWYSE